MSAIVGADGVKRMHVPLAKQDQDGSWFTVCYACSYLNGSDTAMCAEPGAKPWPPFNIVEAPEPKRELNADYIAELNARFNEDVTPFDMTDTLVNMIEHHISNRPRSQQKLIGPSEVGHECSRWITYKLAQKPTVNPAANKPSWRTQIGVFVHDGLDHLMTPFSRRFLTERRIKVATIGNDDIYGTGDLYDAETGSVIDWKCVGPTTLKNVKAVSRETKRPHGASEKYRKQGHTYGKGYEDLGLNVRWIVIAYLPAAGDLRDAYFHIERYDRSIAEAALERMVGIRTLLDVLPFEQVAEMQPTAEVYCGTCPYFDPRAERFEDGCPGHEGRRIRKSSLLSLMPEPADEPFSE